MFRLFAVGVLGTLSLLLGLKSTLFADDAPSQPPKPGGAEKAKDTKPILGARALYALLEKPIEAKPFQTNLTLKEALVTFHALFAKEGVNLPFLVDTEAFKEENPEAPDIHDTQVKLPPFPERMPAGQLLHKMLSRIPTNNGTYVVRSGVIEITTVDRASLDRLLHQSISVNFKDRTLAQVYEDLFDLTGVSIIIDPRVKHKLDVKINANFPRALSLKTVLRLLTNMADLSVLTVDEVLYVTSRDNARTFEEELWRADPRPWFPGMPSPYPGFPFGSPFGFPPVPDIAR
jgi:hypothetical protein